MKQNYRTLSYRGLCTATQEADNECLIVSHSFTCGNDVATELCPVFAPEGINRPEATDKRKVLHHIIRRLALIDHYSLFR
jgi:hypothetical protein